MLSAKNGALTATQGVGSENQTNVAKSATTILKETFHNIGLSKDEDFLLNGKQMINLLHQGIVFYYPCDQNGETYKQEKKRIDKSEDEDQTESFYRIRRTTAEIERLRNEALSKCENVEIGKYDQSKGTGTHPYLFPLFKWIERNNITEDDVIEDLIITEGEKKAIYLSFVLNKPAVAIAGISMYKALSDDQFVDILNTYNIQNVSFLYDGDMFNFSAKEMDEVIIDGKNRIQNFASSIEGVYHTLNDIDRRTAFKRRKPNLNIRCTNPYIANEVYGYKAIDDYPEDYIDRQKQSFDADGIWYSDDRKTVVCLLKTIKLGQTANAVKGIGNQICHISSDATELVSFRHKIGCKVPAKITYKSTETTYDIDIVDGLVKVTYDKPIYRVGGKIYSRVKDGSVDRLSLEGLRVFLGVSTQAVNNLVPSLKECDAVGCYIPNSIEEPYKPLFDEGGVLKLNAVRSVSVEVADKFSSFPMWERILKHAFAEQIYEKRNPEKVMSGYDFILDWLKALCFDMRTSVPVIYLHSQQSCGKSVVMDAIASLVGGYANGYAVRAEMRDFGGTQFNIKFMGKTLITADEALQSKDKLVFNRWLKDNAYGSSVTNFEAKGKDSISAPRYNHIIFCSNDVDAVAMEEEQTRVMAFALSKMADNEFISKEEIERQLEEQRPSFLAFLRDRDYSEEWHNCKVRFADKYTTKATVVSIDAGSIDNLAMITRAYIEEKGNDFIAKQFITMDAPTILSFALETGQEVGHREKKHLFKTFASVIGNAYDKFERQYPEEKDTILRINEERELTKPFCKRMNEGDLKKSKYRILVKVANMLGMINNETAELNQTVNIMDNQPQQPKDHSLPF